MKNLEASRTGFSSSLFVENTEIKPSSEGVENCEFVLRNENSSTFVNDSSFASLSINAEKVNKFFKKLTNCFSVPKFTTNLLPKNQLTGPALEEPHGS